MLGWLFVLSIVGQKLAATWTRWFFLTQNIKRSQDLELFRQRVDDLEEQLRQRDQASHWVHVEVSWAPQLRSPSATPASPAWHHQSPGSHVRIDCLPTITGFRHAPTYTIQSKNNKNIRDRLITQRPISNRLFWERKASTNRVSFPPKIHNKVAAVEPTATIFESNKTPTWRSPWGDRSCWISIGIRKSSTIEPTKLHAESMTTFAAGFYWKKVVCTKMVISSWFKQKQRELIDENSNLKLLPLYAYIARASCFEPWKLIKDSKTINTTPWRFLHVEAGVHFLDFCKQLTPPMSKHETINGAYTNPQKEPEGTSPRRVKANQALKTFQVSENDVKQKLKKAWRFLIFCQ